MPEHQRTAHTHTVVGCAVGLINALCQQWGGQNPVDLLIHFRTYGFRVSPSQVRIEQEAKASLEAGSGSEPDSGSAKDYAPADFGQLVAEREE